MLAPHISPVERLLFHSDVACVGQCRCSPDRPEFRTADVPRASVLAFPRSSVWIRMDDRRAFVADPNIVAFHNPGQAFWRRRISQQGDVCDWFALAPDVLTGVLAEGAPAALDRDGRFVVAQQPVSAEMFLAQRQLMHHLRASPCDRLGVEERIVELCGQVIAEAPTADRRPRLRGRLRDTPRRRAIVEHVRAMLAAGLGERHSLRSLARRAECSVFHLCRVFHSLTGTTLRRYLMELRLRTAWDRLNARTGDLSALALDLGFCSHSHFTAAFTARFGIVPSTVGRRGRIAQGDDSGRPSGDRRSPA